ncbi:SDR family NAD(P)-dependent oxidoreductase [Micromonospora sagamiensis]|uniref:3-oxoacyl-[acyl-carrier protein] reductase n=1 Tax=Micromonospora sagamiensis TaxID=47875 RepID=A0A562WL20_9ACTN|nr:SDR family NAD(P)-dependent oxidoreductase [Micromonospora sagamiensis]TWJ30214.1 3-oxoacyl-[acyl-carrier protein] reductase [Micromonospora sagamiensis]BCL16756.1 short-chain dehydrogenase [Micromonospora sagamiensis]
MEQLLAGKNALVTGGTRGIGRAIVLTLAKAGANVVTCYRSEGEAVESLARELKDTPGQHHLVRADVGDAEQIDQLLAECKVRLGSLDVVVNNAGVISHIGYDDLSLADWHAVVDTNLTGTFLVIQKALPLMGEGASVVNIGSRVAKVGIPMRAHYTAAKAGLVGLTRSLCKELGRRGIRVNLVEPGVIATEEMARLTPEQRAAMEARYAQLTSLGRLGHVDEVAEVVLFLASDKSRYVSGAQIPVDGGI